MTISWLDFLTMACATWYISYVITAQNGPFLILERLRKLSGLFQCIYCLAPYVAGITYLIMRYAPEANLIVYIFAIAGLSLMLRSYTGAGMNGL